MKEEEETGARATSTIMLLGVRVPEREMVDEKEAVGEAEAEPLPVITCDAEGVFDDEGVSSGLRDDVCDTVRACEAVPDVVATCEFDGERDGVCVSDVVRTWVEVEVPLGDRSCDVDWVTLIVTACDADCEAERD